MKIKKYSMNSNVLAGTTLKDKNQPEMNNMALHTCQQADVVLENRRQLAHVLDVPLSNFVCANQTHSANFYRVTNEDTGRGTQDLDTAIQDTDALYSYEPNILLCSFTADCVPVMFYHETNGLIGVIHSGWQGTIKEITLKLFQHLKTEEKCQLDKVHVQIGMALSQEKFEVDDDVYTKFKDLGYADEFMYFKPVTNKYHIDNQLVVKKQCELAGIPTDQISVDRTCTFVNEEGFSYRQDKKCGRHLSFIKFYDEDK
ncbi:peptidoglycan editing factor PgeF [Sporosarcina pasteurii]|uniref:Purine nucleoside phosphorylase n=1 Tax=Sporosarcina pasteurii TaxID=1474 RepID=A0A380CME6_SPOPA|nr:peptidoglycan editing factor PgeF [Sporosarcina pasteurii]SUJ21988.1 Laccase domain protein SAV1187 [Sporosarcina pasteurii]